MSRDDMTHAKPGPSERLLLTYEQAGRLRRAVKREEGRCTRRDLIACAVLFAAVFVVTLYLVYPR